MHLNWIPKLSRRLEFRLTLWYVVAFIASWIILLFTGFSILESSILSKDRLLVTGLVDNYTLIAKNKGMPHLIMELEGETLSHISGGRFVMVADRENKILHLTVPYGWPRLRPNDFQILFEFEPGEPWGYLKTDRYALADHSGAEQDQIELKVNKLVDGSRIWLGHSAESREEYLESFSGIFFTVMGISLLFSVVIGAFMAWRSIAPVRALEETIDRVVSGRMEARISMTAREGELVGLSRQFNRMLDRIEGLVKAMQDALDNVAHDLRTPLTRMNIAIERNAMVDDPVKLKEALFDCAEESQRISKMLTILMDISEAETGVMRLQFVHINLPELFNEVIDIYEYTASEKGISLISSCPRTLRLEADHDRIRQVMCNLVDNAIKYSSTGSRVEISAQKRSGSLEIRISDMGIGIDAGDIDRIFDRLYRSDRSRSSKGSGLGLSLVKAVVQAHNGHISVESQPGKGSVFILSLPLKGNQQ